MADTWDFAVAGSGAGGAAVAARLAEAGARVLLIEKGGSASPTEGAGEAVYRYYAHAGLQGAFGSALLPLPTGIALGGTTVINSGTCLTTPAESLARWEQASGGAFSARAFQARLAEAWSLLHVGTAPRETVSPSTRLFLEGLSRLGVGGGHLLDRAEEGCRGSGSCCFVCPRDAKMTAEKAFLRPLRGRADLEIAERVALEGFSTEPGRVRIVLRTAKRRRVVHAGRLVLSAGALATPYFVRRFRLGPRWRAAGGALSVHPAGKVFAYFDGPVRGWSGVPQGSGLVDPEDPRIRYEGVYTPPELAAVTLPLEGRSLAWWISRYDHVATFGFMVRDTGTGTVRYPWSADYPWVRYDLHPDDVGRMTRAMRFLGRVFFAAGARAVVLPLNRVGNVFQSARALDEADLSGVQARELQMMAFHPLGTCGAGRVTGWDLDLTDRVYACDGSVVPESLGVNPQITIYAFALALARHLLGNGRR